MKNEIDRASIKIESSGNIFIDKDGWRSTTIRINLNNRKVSEIIYDRILVLMEAIYPFKLIYNHREVNKDALWVDAIVATAELDEK